MCWWPWWFPSIGKINHFCWGCAGPPYLILLHVNACRCIISLCTMSCMIQSDLNQHGWFENARHPKQMFLFVPLIKVREITYDIELPDVIFFWLLHAAFHDHWWCMYTCPCPSIQTVNQNTTYKTSFRVVSLKPEVFCWREHLSQSDLSHLIHWNGWWFMCSLGTTTLGADHLVILQNFAAV